MSRASYYTTETPPKAIFREVFNDGQSVLMNRGEPYLSPVIQEGKLINSDQGWYFYNLNVRGAVSVRVIGSVNATPGSTRRFIDGRDGGHSLECTYTPLDTIAGTGLTTSYVNGVATNVITTDGQYYDMVWVFNDSTCDILHVGGQFNGVTSDVNIDTVEVYNYALSAEEVSNLYSNLRFNYPKISPSFHLTSGSGVIEDLQKRSFTNTDVNIVKEGDFFTHDYNGSTSNLEFSDLPLSAGDDFTISFWAKYSLNNRMGLIVSRKSITDRVGIVHYINGRIYLETYDGTYHGCNFLMTSYFNSWVNICFTKSGSVFKAYLNGVEQAVGGSAGLLGSLTINRAIIGSESIYDFKGKLGDIIIDDLIWNEEEISQYYTASKFKYER